MSNSSKVTFALMAAALTACATGEGPAGVDPVLLAMSPNAANPQPYAIPIFLNGSNFQPGAVATWNGADRPTDFTSSTELVVTLAVNDLDQPDTVQVRVRNPDGGTSDALRFRVADGAIAFGIDSVRPLNGQDASLAEPVTFYFNDVLDIASVTNASVTISDGTSEIAGAVSMAPSQRAIQVNAPFAPLTRYVIDLVPGIRSQSGGGQLTPFSTVIFTAKAAFARLSPTGGYVSAALGSDNRAALAFMHTDVVTQVTHAAAARCSAASNCMSRAGWTIGFSDAGPQAGYLISLAMTGTTPLMTWESGSIRYSSGASLSSLIDAGNSDVTWPSIAVGGARAHVIYYAGGAVKHATCGGICAPTANWTISTVDQTGNSGAYSDVVADGAGVHAIYYDNAAADLRYAHCSLNCTSPDWTSTVVESSGIVGTGADLALAADGSLHVVYLDQTRAVVRYGYCAAACDSTANWILADITQPGDAVMNQAAIAVGPGTVNVVYQRSTTGHIFAATCVNGCDTIAGWQHEALSVEPGFAGFEASLVVDPAGVRHLLWSTNAVKYMQY